MSVLTLPTCPDDCAGSLPKFNFNVCAPVLKYGEVEKIFLARPDADDFTNVEDLTEWAARLTSEITDDDHIEALMVKAEFPEPEVNEQELSGDRTAVGFMQFTVQGVIDENNDTNYQAMLTLQCNLKFKMWFLFADGSLYGGNEGVSATVRAHESATNNRAELRVINFNAKWKAKHAPLRSIYPLT